MVLAVRDNDIDLLRSGEVWAWYNVDGSNKDPFIHFKNKYGFLPTRAVIGKGTEIDLPDYVSSASLNVVLAKGHVWLQ